MREKIIFYLNSLSGGGAERTVVNIINNLNHKKYEVVLVLGTNKNNDYIHLISKNIKVKIINSSGILNNLLKLRKCIIEEKPDLLFSTLNPNNLVLLVAKMLTFRKIPTIIREANNRTASGYVSTRNKLMTYFLYNYFAKKIVALSKGVKVDLVENFKIRKDKIEVIYNPVEVEKIKKLSLEKVDDLTISKDEKVIIAVGRLVEQKDFITLIRSMPLVLEKTKAKLIILGKGPLEFKLKKLSEDLEISDNIEFLGFRNNPYKYMFNADLFVLTSKWEGFGHVIVEAMATGTPVIATDCDSGPVEIIKSNKYGVLVPVGNQKKLSKKIIELLKDEKKLKVYKKYGYLRAKDFDASNIVLQYEKLFSSLN